MKIVATLAAVSAFALVGSAALAQQTTVTASAPVANPPPVTTPPTTANADTGYAGDLHGQAFREIEPRIAMLKGKAHGKAATMLAKIEGEAKFRRARHGGELRDWDRELLNKQLDQVQAMVGG